MINYLRLPDKAIKKFRATKVLKKPAKIVLFNKGVLTGVIPFRNPIVSETTIDEAINKSQDITKKVAVKDLII